MFLIKNKWMLLISFLIHIVFLLSIFDIYFKSPIVDGIRPLVNDVPATAKRLVLFIGDGLRADYFFQVHDENEVSAPYLRQVIETRGRWGLSHARVPTESRPGHVAIIAGIYEDPSAIFKGWKDNPIEFDSVFNQSYMTYAWGSPDILTIFNKNSKKSNIITETYPPNWEQFSSKIGSAARLSLWSFQSFHDFLTKAKFNRSLHKQLSNSKIIFFIHLLGIDTAGHSDKPHSKEYMDNIRVADNIVRQTENLINEFYENDNGTIYMFTSDHGMTDWGSHGEGLPSETETPFVTWGAGILGPEKNYQQHSPLSWKLNHLTKTDIQQADMTPLFSILLGISIPVHSIGILPLDILNFTLSYKSAAIILNARQISAQFVRKEKLVEENTLRWLYKPYGPLSFGKVEHTIKLLEQKFHEGSHDEVISGSIEFIKLCLLGLDYYHNYYQQLLLFCISTSYIGWILWLLLNILSDNRLVDTRNKDKEFRLYVLNCSFGFLIFVTVVLLIVQFLPLQYYLYCCLPFVIWWNVLKKFIITNYTTRVFSYSFFGTLTITIISTELVVLSFFERRVLSVLLFVLLIWYVLSTPYAHIYTSLISMWIFSCISLMAFPFLPVIGAKPNNIYIVFSTSIWLLLIYISRIYLRKHKKRMSKISLTDPFCLTGILFCITLYNILSITYNYSAKNGLSLLNQSLSWLTLILVPTRIIFCSRKIIIRLLNIYFSFGIVCLLFSLHYDSLFLPLFSFNLFMWLWIEAQPYDNYKLNFKDSVLFRVKFTSHVQIDNVDLKWHDFRRAFYFFFYTVFSFFGTGNIASINSFDVSWVRCFITLFAPFTMMTLILIKTVIPFFVTACTFQTINNITKVSVDKIFLIVLVYCDIMSLNFLFLVKNTGSWLEIGSSVSHYVISQTIVLFLVLLYYSSIYLTSIKIKNINYYFCTFKYFIFKYND